MNSIAFVVLALAACAHGAAVSGWGGGQRVAGGEDAQPHEFPHHVSMQTSTLWLIERHICGGAIISPEWVLTAAHCVRSVPWYSSAFILAGRHSLSAKSEEGQQRAAVRAMHVHEKYAKGQTAHDIALLHLKTPLVFSDTVQAAVLPAAGSIPTAGFFMVSGWGQVGENKDGNVLQKMTLPVIPFNKCSAFFQQAGLTTPLVDTEICVGNLQVKGQSTCHGDGGSPLSLWNVGLNSWTVAGVSAFATMPCGAQPTPSVYTRVSAYIDWIQSTMNKV